MNYSNQKPTEAGYYFVNNGYIDLVAQVYESAGELVYTLLPSLDGKTSQLRDTREGLLWCRIYPPNPTDHRAEGSGA